MFKKLLRYYHTLRHLKLIQIQYQLWYRLRDKLYPVRYPADIKAPLFKKLVLQPFPSQHKHYLNENYFQFINLKQNFKEVIDWNYLGHGKLWAYHLNYFDYLHQYEMSWKTGKKLIDEFLEQPENRIEGMEPYPISLRNINWIKFLVIHKQYPRKIVDSIYAQYQVLSKKLEYHLLGNHLLENGFSLLFGAVFFQDEKLTKLAHNILSKELKEQILDDGAHFELSPMYHLILLQRALDGFNILKNNKHDLSDIQQQLKRVIQKMVNWLATVTFSNGDIPMFNDSTDGQALKSHSILNYAIKLGFKSQKTTLSDSGYRKFEFGDFEMVADVGEVGPGYQPGHAHSDTLSFVLYHKGDPVIVDRGISTYEKNERRQLERSTASHNTVMINDVEQTDVWGGFRVGKRSKPIIWDDSYSKLNASHTGYDNSNVRHNRKWQINENGVEIIDRLEGDKVDGIAYLHIHPSVSIKEVEKGIFNLNDNILSFENFMEIQKENYAYCLGFNKTELGDLIKVKFKKVLKTKIKE